jgi:EAL domain-containing protein (putative c-di-GMP-specific phosphodiesterase class I)
MYRAKQAGKAQVAYFTEAMSREVEHNLEIRNLLRTAVEKQRLVLLFQPQFDIRTGRMRGIEALLRLMHPRDGLLGPEAFLELAERSELILDIEDWVLEQTVRMGLQFLSIADCKMKIAVNISSRRLFSKGFVDKVAAVLRNQAFPPECLEIELTESSFIKDLTGAKAIFQAIKQLGVGLAIDDFGTGHSSLNHLAILPFDVLKIARSFTTVVEVFKKHEAVFDGILTIANSLGIEIIAEGVETSSQLDFLNEKGVHFVQGFYFSQPVSEEQLLALPFLEHRNSAD